MADDSAPKPRVALPIAPGEDTLLRRSVREAAFDVLSAAGPRAVFLATELMEDVLDAAIAPDYDSEPRAACSRGCHYCCHLYVGVTAPEAMAAVRWAEAHFPPDDLDALRARMKSNAENASGKAPGEYPRQPCAFLVDRACSIHPARPAPCRAAHSVDVAACIAAYEAPPGANLGIRAKKAVRENAGEVRTGYTEALAHAGMDRRLYELQQVCHLLSAEPEREERWLAGDVTALEPARAIPPR